MKLNDTVVEKIVSNVIKSVLKESKDYDLQFDNIIKNFSSQINDYIESEEERINRLKKISQNVIRELINSNQEIINIGFNISNITLKSDNLKYVISYYIANSDKWNDDDSEQYETELYYIERQNKYIDIELVNEINSESHIDISFIISDYE